MEAENKPPSMPDFRYHTTSLSQANSQIRSYDGKALNEKDQKYKAEKGNTILR